MSEHMIPNPSAYSYQVPASAPTLARTVPANMRSVSPTSIALALASPAVSITALILSRHWSEHGAMHSLGDLWPLTVGVCLSMSGAAYAQATRDPLLVGTCVSLAGACAAIGTMAYPSGLSEPLITCLMATVTGWVLARRHVRTRRAVHEEYADRRDDRAHRYAIVATECQTAVSVAEIKAQGKVAVARIEAMAELQIANTRADAIDYHVWQIETAERRSALMATPSIALEPIEIASVRDVLEHADTESRRIA